FYTVAVDRAGNVEASPATADTSTFVDTVTSASTATSPQYSTSTAITISYTASDPGPNASGLDKVELWVRTPGASAYGKAMTDTAPAVDGSFAYTAAAGDGSYSFYTVSSDKAGNVEKAPAAADTSTFVDTALPTSSASSPHYPSSAPFTASYTASDPGANASGLDRVDLWVKTPGSSSYAKTATSTSGSFTYSATGDGSYGFY